MKFIRCKACSVCCSVHSPITPQTIASISI